LEGGGRVGGGGRPDGQVLAALAAYEEWTRAPGRWLSIKGGPRTRGNHNLSVEKSAKNSGGIVNNLIRDWKIKLNFLVYLFKRNSKISV
jgi:hypothetical protein